MADPLLRHVTSGNETHYGIGTAEHGWTGFDVVGFRAFEGISQPFRYEITLVRSKDSGPVDLAGLVDAPATFVMATMNRWRRVHGILAEAECLERTSELLLYRVLLVPHWWRARFRRHCRNYVNRTLREIISDVLQNRSYENRSGLDGLSLLQDELQPPPESFDPEESFVAPTASFRWAVDVTTRLTNRNLRSYVVQYNETDFDFVSRLLEEEGISYYFEHAADRLVMTLSDKPGSSPLFPRDERFEMHTVADGMGEAQAESIFAFHERRTLRENQVTMRDFDWHRSHMVLEGTAKAPENTTASADYHEFPARDEREYDEPCQTPAEIRMQRFDAAQQLARGTGSVRRMEPGYCFTLHDHLELVDAAEYLVVEVETSACQLDLETTEAEPGRLGLHEGHGLRRVPWHVNRFRALDHEVTYRPPSLTQKPRIDGVQTAKVTAEEFESEAPEINTDEHARVRVRFPWDERPEDEQAPTSDWVRVSQGWAGPRYGALYHPRVGHEVLVAYLQGDPDRPVIVGRVYNVQNPPPYDGEAQPTVSTLKSQSSPDATGFNEFRFEDLAGREEIYLHAQRDLNERINHDHTTDVGHDQVDTVGNDQAFRITQHQSTQVGGNQSMRVAGSRTLTVGGDETITIGDDRIRSIGKNCKVSVGKSRSAFIVGDNSVGVGGNESLTVSGERRVYVDGAESYTVSNKRIVKCEGIQREITGDRVIAVSGDNRLTVDGAFELKAGGTLLRMEQNKILLESGGGARIELDGGQITINGTKVFIEAAAECDIKGTPIKLNC
ncbi:MAG: type VI secretion system tip protein VgrG [Myxococcales bacterium]|nr:type VI secretion system tip protein VgrG [Myxococcales bacterium]